MAKTRSTYTPQNLVCEMLDTLPEDAWIDGKRFLDPECGSGNFLAEVAKRKVQLGHNAVLETIYGTDIKLDVVEQCRRRLLEVCGNTEENRAIVERNIRCENTLEYDFSFE